MSTEFELKDLIKDGIEKLQKASDLDATVDAWLLAEEVLGITRVQYFINPQRLVNKEDADKFFKFIDLTRFHHNSNTFKRYNLLQK